MPRSGPSLRTVLIFGTLLTLASILFCWQYGVYRDWREANRNPRAGILLKLGRSKLGQFRSTFEVKHPAFIREELKASTDPATAKIHFICPVSGEGDFLVLEGSREADRWILALPLP